MTRDLEAGVRGCRKQGDWQWEWRAGLLFKPHLAVKCLVVVGTQMGKSNGRVKIQVPAKKTVQRVGHLILHEVNPGIFPGTM